MSKLPDRITLKSIAVHAGHGYYDEEREKGNRFEIDLTATGNFREASQKDDLAKTFDYEKAEQAVLDVMHGSPEKLIETLCGNIGDRLFEEFTLIETLSVTVRKLNPPIKSPAAYAEITIRWNRQ